MAIDYNDPRLLADPQYAALLASLGLTDEFARADKDFYASRNTRDEGRLLPEMERTNAIADQNLGLGYEQSGFARSSVRQDAGRNLDASQNYAMEGARLGFQDRGVDLERGLASNLAESDRRRALGYGDADARAHERALQERLYAPPPNAAPPAPPVQQNTGYGTGQPAMAAAPTSVDRPRSTGDPYKRKIRRPW